MKKIYLFLLFFYSLQVLSASPIKQFTLNPQNVYTIKLSPGNGVTTVMFPSALDAIYGANIVQKPKEAGGYLLSYTPGQYYFSLRTIKPGSTGSLNIVYERNVYVVKLITAKRGDEYASVSFVNDGLSRGGTGEGRSNYNVGPKVLLAAIDKAKYYPLYLRDHPDSVADVGYTKKNQVFKYRGYSVTLNSVYRFDSIDTLVFWVVLKNDTDKIIKYNPQNLAVRCGLQIYFTSLTDASGLIPPNGTTQAYFTITGTPEGGKNFLSSDNDFTVLLSANNSDNTSEESITQTKRLAIIQQMESLNRELSNTKDSVKVKSIVHQYTELKKAYELISGGKKS